MNVKLITPGQAAQLLGVGSSTLRLWSKQFAAHLSEAAQPGGKRRRHYTAEDLATLARARDMLREGRSVADVLARLSVVESDAVALVMTDQAAREVFSQLRSEMAALNDRVATQQAELEAMRARVDDLTARRSWWDRLRGR